ncbi:MAG TPA: rhomboid family intramembrane serine protease [Syntrophales bacterium]|nr:rhomboid family intramembrane serine protease [Syntrophales bacterium]
MSVREKNSILCPNCRKLISADEPECPYCGLSRPGSRLKTNFLSKFLSASIDAVKIIIYINIAFYILSILLNPSSLGFSTNPLTLLSPSDKSLFLLGATGTIPIAGYGRWWTLVSASFLHGGILHIFFNMAALAQLGPFVLREFGFNRFVVIYVLTGIAGFFISFLAGISFTIGASASICGLIGAIIYYGKSRGGFYGEVIYRQAMGWVIGLVLFGILVPGINNWAHGGGLVSGIMFAFLIGYNEKKGETFLHRFLAIGCMGLTFIVLMWAVLQALYLSLSS